ncbi:hypothetical protein PL321_17215 [Caloramator sp. mosi_1]|uniref:hypothetical protein n=1 Tax=Caloramator sp. mosi_1 TaxID=3023090 RepID=UPI00235E0255|nr:hypothetical protein [Caloramator sp. mosi_1]WDC84046.1 hypothetical protein PL321_17215 [Caloramator sp. mosi_1]
MFKRYQSAKELIEDIIKVKENPNAVINNFDETQSTRIIDAKELDKALKNKRRRVLLNLYLLRCLFWLYCLQQVI